MKIITHKLENNSITLYPFADWHIGSPKCNYKLIKAQIEEVKNDDNARVILLGDIINMSLRNSVGDCYEEELTPMEQAQHAINLLEPIKDKILAITTGNHERRAYKDAGQDITWFIAKCLGLESVYDSTSVMVFLRFGRNDKNRPQCYTIYSTHGSGGGSTVGGKANALSKRGNIVNADIVITGHTHQPLTWKECNYEIDYANSNVKLKETTFVNVASTLDYEAYAETYGLKPSNQSNPVIKLEGDKKDVHVFL